MNCCAYLLLISRLEFAVMSGFDLSNYFDPEPIDPEPIDQFLYGMDQVHPENINVTEPNNNSNNHLPDYHFDLSNINNPLNADFLGKSRNINQEYNDSQLKTCECKNLMIESCNYCLNSVLSGNSTATSSGISSQEPDCNANFILDLPLELKDCISDSLLLPAYDPNTMTTLDSNNLIDNLTEYSDNNTELNEIYANPDAGFDNTLTIFDLSNVGSDFFEKNPLEVLQPDITTEDVISSCPSNIKSVDESVDVENNELYNLPNMPLISDCVNTEDQTDKIFSPGFYSLATAFLENNENEYDINSIDFNNLFENIPLGPESNSTQSELTETTPISITACKSNIIITKTSNTRVKSLENDISYLQESSTSSEIEIIDISGPNPPSKTKRPQRNSENEGSVTKNLKVGLNPRRFKNRKGEIRDSNNK